jgi:hypothetical protein
VTVDGVTYSWNAAGSVWDIVTTATATVAVTAPVTNTGTSTAAVLGIKTSPVFSGDGTNNIVEFKKSNGVTRTWITPNGSDLYVGGNTAESGSVQIGHGATGNQFAYVDLIGDTTYSDYGTRLIRANGGPNTDTALEHRGTGALNVQTPEGVIRMWTASTNRFEIANNGHITMPAQPLWNSDIASGTNIYSTFNANINNGSGFAQPNSSTIVVQTAGKYFVSAQQLLQTAGGGYWQLQKNGVTVKHAYASTSSFMDYKVQCLLDMAAGDTIRMFTAITLTNSWNSDHASLAIIKVA